jgi:hypothetical protein
MLEELDCKHHQQVSFRCAEIAGQQVSGGSFQPQRGEARQDAPHEQEGRNRFSQRPYRAQEFILPLSQGCATLALIT